jgi:predicted membrane-bound spermidine synthase
MPTNYTALVFLTNFTHLVILQLVLRRLQILLPVDLSAWTLVLVMQFGLAVVLLAQLARLESILRPTRLVVALLCVKMLSLVAIALAPASTLWSATFYFAAANAELALLFRFSPQLGGESLARVNLYTNFGAASGLYLAEKLAFQMFGIHTIALALSLWQVIQGWLWYTRLAAPVEYADQRNHKPKLPWSAHAESALAGMILFAGLLLAHRVLRIYLTDTADIIAEITVFSLCSGALVSHFFPLLMRLSAPFFSLLQLICGVAFSFFIMQTDRVLALPRELVLLAGLMPLAVAGTGSYLKALSQAQSAQNVLPLITANLAGSLLGAVVWGYFLIPSYGIEKSLALFSATLFLWLTVRLVSVTAGTVRKLAYGVPALAAIFLTIIPALNNTWLPRQLAQLAQRVAPGEQIINTVETPQDIWLLTARISDGVVWHHRMIRNSHSMSGSLYPSRRYMKLMAYLGHIYAAKITSALNIGYGTGLTAQALAELPLSKIDIVDVAPEVARLASQLLARENRADPLKDSRVSYHLGGARYFLQQSSMRYDIITGEPPPPANSSIAYLYTREFYQLVRDHLADGGVFTYWLPTHSVTDASSEAIWQTFCSVFVHCDLYAGTEANLIMVGYTATAQIALDERLQYLSGTRLARDTGLREPAEVFSLVLRSSAHLPQVPANAHILTDNAAYIAEDYPASKKHFWGLPGIPFHAQASVLERVIQNRFVTQRVRPDKLSPVLIYSADSVFDPFRALRSLEALQQRGISAELALWLLGVDPGLQVISTLAQSNTTAGQRAKLALLLAQGSLAEARAFTQQLSQQNPEDEFSFALKILTDRLTGHSQQLVRHEAIAFTRKRARVSSAFAQYAGL